MSRTAARGIGYGAAALAIGLAVVALAGVPALTTAPDLAAASIGAAAGALGASTISVAVLIWSRSRLVRRVDGLAWTLQWFAGLIAVFGAIGTAVVAHLFSEHRDTLRLLDVRSASVLSVAAAGCAAFSAAAASVEVTAIRSGVRLPRRSARQILVAAVATMLAATAAVGAFGVGFPPADLSDAIIHAHRMPVPGAVTGLDDTAFRLRSPIAEGDLQVIAAGPGFVQITEGPTGEGPCIDGVAGTTGEIRWRFKSADFGKLGVYVLPSPIGDVVVVRGRTVAVGLDANTGEERWRSASEVLRFGVGGPHTGTVRLVGPSRVGDDGRGEPASLVVIDPESGRERARLRHPCTPSFTANADLLVNTVCDGDEIEVTNLDSLETKRVTLPGGAGQRIERIDALGGDLVAARFSTTTVVFDAKTGEQLDQFTGPQRWSRPSVLRDGVFAMPLPGDEGADAVIFRDIGVHRSTTVRLRHGRTVRASSTPEYSAEPLWVGSLLVLDNFGAPLVVDRSTNRVAERPTCTASSDESAHAVRTIAVPGALVVVCTGPSFASYQSEIVGLR